MNIKFYTASILFLLAGLFSSVKAQTSLFTENFNGTSHSFTLNTTDVSSSNDANNYNYWIVNNLYTGGQGTAGNCPIEILPGFPVDVPMTYTFQSTPTQPAGIAGGPTSNYLHITSKGGPFNAGYLGVDNNCLPAQNYFTRMSNDVSTNGFSIVTLKFWWIGTGANNSHIELYYSTNGGNSWTMVQEFVANYTFSNPNYVYANNPNWVQQSVSIPQFANQATLRFGFRLMNGVHNNQIYTPGVGYGFDDIEIIGSNSTTSPTITTSFAPQASYCPGAQISVPFTSTGTFTGSNAYKVQLSDASGSFASPVEIGSFTSTANSGNIPATIPVGASAGSAYRVRVVSTSPSVTGSPNATDFAIGPGGAIPITTDPAGVTNLCTGSITLSIPAGYTNVQWSPGNQTSNSIVVTTPGDYSVTGTSASGCQSQSEVLTVTAAAAPVANFTYVQPSGYLVEFTNTSENGVTYFWNFGSATTTSVNPTFTFPFDGDYPVTLIVTSPCGSDTITITVEVKKNVNPDGIDEVKPFEELSLYPNPVKETLQLMVKSKGTTASNISIYNAIGGKVLDENMVITGEQVRQINFKGFSPGVYFVRISSNKGQSTYRIVKD